MGPLPRSWLNSSPPASGIHPCRYPITSAMVYSVAWCHLLLHSSPRYQERIISPAYGTRSLLRQFVSLSERFMLEIYLLTIQKTSYDSIQKISRHPLDDCRAIDVSFPGLR